MFKKLSDKPVAEVQKEQVKEWNEQDLLDKCVKAREGQPQFVFYEGPPTANGKPGIHHVMARTLKDSINRYKTMQGFQVNRKAGWDTHGLPVEIEVEKQLGFDGKQDIERYGIREFNKKCRESVFTYTGMWRDMSERMGYMADMDHPYITLDNDYIETEWWILKQFFGKDMIYEGHKILPYCPRCGTGLASHEVAQGYKDVKVNTLIVKFKRKDRENEYFLAWTTTPWTLASNTVITVGPDYDYIRARMTEGEDAGNVFYVAKHLADKVLGEGKYEILEEMKGKDLEYIEYEQLMPFVKAAWITFPLRTAQASSTPPRPSVKMTISAAVNMIFRCCSLWTSRAASPRPRGRDILSWKRVWMWRSLSTWRRTTKSTREKKSPTTIRTAGDAERRWSITPSPAGTSK